MTDDTARWTAEDYAPVVTLSGAEKLADSQVAPLVAQARGYETVNDDDHAKKVAQSAYTAEERKVTFRLKSMVKGGNDFMSIPWFRVSDVIKSGAAVKSGTIQVRPGVPLPNASGKPAKYELLTGHASVIDTHPGTPEDWFENTTRFLITEGCLKGDSAVTAQLLAAGVTREELAVVRGIDTEEARRRLQQLMHRVDPRDRTPVLSFIGVGNWHNNPEWDSLVFRDRDVLVAFDGDLRSNRHVWNQAERLWRLIDESKKGNPKLLDLGGVNAEKDQAAANFEVGKKVGLDDYLSHIGTWTDLLKLVEPGLPPQPVNDKDSARPGEFRVTEDGHSVVEYTKLEGGEFGGATYAWVERVPMGGRIKQVTSLRVLTDVAVRSGFARPGAVVDSAKGDCIIEIQWTDEATGHEVTREVHGPRSILESPPSEWGRKGARIHTDILRHPAWPPRNKLGDGFLSAIKAHRITDQDVLDGWDTMGYVPTLSGNPVFVVGNQSLGASRADERDNRPGVTEESMPMATNYGVNDTYWQFVDTDDLDGWKAQIREDIATVVDAFITNSAWKRPAIGPTVLAAALRPTAPGTTSINLFVSGAPGTGKSYLASFQMSFWGAKPGIWTVHNLPGQANDTSAAREHSVARTPLYVIDDLAPNVSRMAAERQEAGVEEAIRAKFNNAGKRRGTADGDQRAVAHPRALQILTAENRRDTLSIQQRMIGIHLASRQEINSDRAGYIEQLTKDPRNPLARLTAAMIRFWLNIDINQTELPFMRSVAPEEEIVTWEQKYDFMRTAIDEAKELIQVQLEARYGINTGTSARRAGMFAELFVTLDILHALALWAGMSETDPALAPFNESMGDVEVLRGAMIDLAAQDLQEFRARSNSRNLLEAIRSLLESGKAHLEHPTLSGARPVQTGEYADYYNRAAGWRVDPRGGEWIPQGTPIGFLGVPIDAEDENDYVALISPPSAFNLAQREHPTLVPAGQKSGDTWNQVWEDEDGAMVHPRYQRPANGRETSVKARIVGAGSETGKTGVERQRGVPVRLSELIPTPNED